MKHGCVAALGGMLTAALAAVPTAGAKEFVYGSWVAARHGVNTEGLEPFFDQVRKDTNGSVDWKLLAGGQVVGPRSTLPGVRDRVVDAGLVIPVFTRKALPHINVPYDLQMFGDNQLAGAGASMEMILLHCAECRQDYKKNNTIYLAGYSTTPFQLVCTSEITTVEDLMNKKVRAAGSAIRWFKFLKAVPVAMPVSEAVTAIERNAITCSHASIAWLRSYGFADVAKHFVEYPMGFPRMLCMFCMNRGAWDSMSTAEKQVMLDHLPAASARATILGYLKEDIEVREWAEQDKGVKFVKGGEDFAKKRAAFKKTELQAMLKTGEELGVDNAQPLIDMYLSLYDKWEKLTADVGLNVDAYTRILKREIYDKLDPAEM